jgi:eukaryotic-like serine/threonine-protein kinase
MRTGRAGLARAIDSVVEGTGGLDWGLTTIELDNERDRELLRHIRLLSQISDVQRTQAGVLDDAALRARARALASVLPFGDPARVRGDEAPTRSQDLSEPAPKPRWGRLELLELVGSGTFGDVYRARDLQLQREVAVKLLRKTSPHAGLVDRMLHEARALAQVRHPNVVVVHDAEERDGCVGLCMEFIRGRTLSQILATEGARGAREAALIGQELCHALAAVHAAGLVHRDVKAQNVMREHGGRVVLMDFGAGLPLSDGGASPGSVTGTPLYLAPEVLEHGQASVRSDIYSLGVLLYHLVTNDYPVHGRTPADLIEAHRQGRVRRLRDVAPTLPSWFVRAVERAIAPNPKDRFATAGEFEAALGDRPSMRVWPLLVAAALTLAVVGGVQQAWSRLSGPANFTPLVVLMPLDAGLGVEPHMAYAIGDEIYQGLAMVDTLRVISQESAAKAKRDQLTIVQVADRLGASAVAAGSVSRQGDQFAVKLRVFLAGADSPALAETFPASSTTFVSLRRAAALSVARAMRVNVPTRILTRLERPVAASAQAYESYARGRYLHARGTGSQKEQALVAFERALELESSFAPAHAALAHLHLDLGSSGRTAWATHGELARIAAWRALELDPGLGEAEAVLAEVAFQLDWDWNAAAAAFRRAVALSTSYEYARQRYAHFLAARGQVEQGLAELQAVQRLDPYSDNTDLELVPMLQYAGRLSEAETIALAVQGRAPNSTKVHVQLGRIYAATGRFDRAAEEFLKVVDATVGSAYVDAEVASAYAGAGRIADAQTILDRLDVRARSEDVPPELFSLVYTRLGQVDEAFAYLERAFELRSRRILWLKVDPRWDPLRADPRFKALLGRLGL